MTLRRDLDKILTSEPKTLAKRSLPAPHWREAVDGSAPRLGPRQYIGADITRSGRFRDVDPLVTPRLWNRWRWAGFLGWGALAAGSLWRAYRLVGSPFGTEDDPDT